MKQTSATADDRTETNFCERLRSRLQLIAKLRLCENQFSTIVRWKLIRW